MPWGNRALAAAIARLSRDFTYENLRDTGQLPPFIKAHLINVYLTLFAALACMSIGYALDIYGNLGGTVTFLGIIGSSAWFWRTDPWKEKQRVILLMVIGLCIGVSLAPAFDLLTTIGALYVGPLIGLPIAMDKAAAGLLERGSDGSLMNSVIRSDQRDVLLAISGAAAIFLCFGAAARNSRSRLEMYVYGVMPSSALLVAGSDTFQMNYMFLWLIGHVVAYSQEIAVRARRGDNYFTQHCVAFFLDIIPFSFHLGLIALTKLHSELRKLHSELRNLYTSLLNRTQGD